MKLVLALLTLVTFTLAFPSQETEVLKGVDFDAFFGDDKQREAVFNCMLEKAPCGDIQNIIDSVVILIKNRCETCNPEEKQKYDHAMKIFHDKYGSVYNELLKRIHQKN